jgi:polysaccharide export outer membrane protein
MRTAFTVGLCLTALCALFSAAPAKAHPNDYAIGPGDLLQISVSGYPELATNARVSETGTISFPYLDPLIVKSTSSSDVETLIAQRLTQGKIIKNPQVSVLVIDYQSQMAAVMGQVNKPGQYPLITSRRVIDLLADAGGPIVGQAGGGNIGIAGDEATLVRRDGSSIKIDLGALFSGDQRQNATVGSGDTIYVPRAAQFYVYGEVQKAGVYPLQRQMTVAQAISVGGGLTTRGSDHRIQLRRRDVRGNEYQTSVRISDLVQPDDVLVVRQRIF